MCFFDDHQNAVERIKSAVNRGFKYLIFEDNYPIGQGDCVTLKQRLSYDDEISKYLKKKNFKVLQLSKLNFIDQIRLFNNCKQVIAPHGAGLTNLIFCKKNTRVLEIFPKNHNQTRVYKKISKINNLNYTSIKCDKTIFSKKGDMLLDVKLIQKYLNTNDSNI